LAEKPVLFKKWVSHRSNGFSAEYPTSDLWQDWVGATPIPADSSPFGEIEAPTEEGDTRSSVTLI
jgi:predicted nucleotidyltransferase